MISTGSFAPEIRFRTQTGDWFCPKDLRGQKLILFFCPLDAEERDYEIADFAMLASAFARCGAWIVGILPSGAALEKRSFGKGISLVEDVDGSGASSFSVWLNGGAPAQGTAPATFFYDRDGRLCHIWRNAPLAGHACKVLEAAEGFK